LESSGEWPFPESASLFILSIRPVLDGAAKYPSRLFPTFSGAEVECHCCKRRIGRAPGQDWLDVRADAPPEELIQAIGKLRKEARDEIDRLIQFLDKTDDYVSRELEDEVDAGRCDDDELERSFVGIGASAPVERFSPDEAEADYGGFEADDEPPLGFWNAIAAPMAPARALPATKSGSAMGWRSGGRA
jgi:hypothetical protein